MESPFTNPDAVAVKGGSAAPNGFDESTVRTVSGARSTSIVVVAFTEA